MFTKYDEEREEYTKVEEPDPSLEYTYADYYGWQFLERLELIRGRIFRLSAPRTNHVVVSSFLFVKLYNLLGKACFAFIAPFDVRLPKKGKTADHEITTVVQPDVGVICDFSKLDERGCCGTPEFLVEVLSPSNRRHDVRVKHDLYEEAGVKEYWIADPIREYIEVCILNQEGKYGERTRYSGDEVITSIAVNGFSVSVKDVFSGKFKFRKK